MVVGFTCPEGIMCQPLCSGHRALLILCSVMKQEATGLGLHNAYLCEPNSFSLVTVLSALVFGIKKSLGMCV